MTAGESGGDATDVCLACIYGEGCGTHCETDTHCNHNGRCSDRGGARAATAIRRAANSWARCIQRSLMINSAPQGPYSRNMPRALW